MTISSVVGKPVRIYLNCTKGHMVSYGKGKKKKKRVLSFKGFIKEIKKDAIVLRGTFIWDGWLSNGNMGAIQVYKHQKGFRPRFTRHKLIHQKHIMRIVNCDPNEIKIFEK